MTYEQRIMFETEMKIKAGRSIKSLTRGISGYTAPREQIYIKYGRNENTFKKR